MSFGMCVKIELLSLSLIVDAKASRKIPELKRDFLFCWQNHFTPREKPKGLYGYIHHLLRLYLLEHLKRSSTCICKAESIWTIFSPKQSWCPKIHNGTGCSEQAVPEVTWHCLESQVKVWHGCFCSCMNIEAIHHHSKILLIPQVSCFHLQVIVVGYNTGVIAIRQVWLQETEQPF
jgi:hypothetical protein